MKPRDGVDQQLRESELRLKIALRAAEIGIWDWNLATNEMAYSARARSIFGFPVGEPITYEMVRDATHPDDLPRTHALADRALDPEQRDRSPYEYRIVRADTGEVRWVLAHGEAIFSGTGGSKRAVRFLGTIQDITARKETEMALQKSELRQRLAIDAAHMAVWELDIATDEVRGSAALNRIYGFPDDARPTIDDFRSRYAPGERERVQEVGSQALARGESQFEVEFRCQRIDEDDFRWFLLRADVLFTADGEPDRVIGVLMDIDDRKRAADRQALLLRELNHRVNNSLTVVQSLAAQTFRDNPSSVEELKIFQQRLHALSRANSVLLQQGWQAFGLLALIQEIIAPYRETDEAPFQLVGSEVLLSANVNVSTALALHELCTNAAKYGALSQPGGRVEIEWHPTDQGIALTWTEADGPWIASPGEQGFGMRLLTRVLARELGGLELSFRQEGVRCAMVLPVAEAAQS